MVDRYCRMLSSCVYCNWLFELIFFAIDSIFSFIFNIWLPFDLAHTNSVPIQKHKFYSGNQNTWSAKNIIRVRLLLFIKRTVFVRPCQASFFFSFAYTCMYYPYLYLSYSIRPNRLHRTVHSLSFILCSFHDSMWWEINAKVSHRLWMRFHSVFFFHCI